MKKKITREMSKERHAIFCRVYVKTLNASEAARAAGYSEKGANVTGTQLLAKPNIRKTINQMMQKREKRLELDGDLVLRELIDLAKSDITKCFDESGALLPMEEWPQEMRQSVAGVEVKERINPVTGEVTGHTKKLKLWDKPKSLELLGRHLKLFTDVSETQVKAEVEAKVSITQVEDTLEKIRKEY